MNKDSLDYIYRLYMNDIYAYLLSLCGEHHLAQDILQETFFRAYLYLEDFKEDKIKPWLFKVAHNALVDFKRKNSRSIVKEGEYFKNLADYTTPEKELIKQEQLKDLKALVNELTEDYRQAVLLCDIHELSYKESAEVMGVGVGYFKILLYRARQKLRMSIKRSDCNE